MQSITRRGALRLGATMAAAAVVGSTGLGRVLGQGRPSREGDAPDPAVTLANIYKDGKFVLPPLPYKADALGEAYTARALDIHYSKHHANYVRGLNATLDKLAKARQERDYAHIQALSNALAFNGSGHVLHSLFWNSMTPGGAKPPRELLRAMGESLDSFEAASAQFEQAAINVESNGWAVLAYEPTSRKLLILQAGKHQDLTVWGVTPLLVCDVWEHAYYLQYQNRRADWVKAFMTIANWPYAARRLAMAKRGMEDPRMRR